MNLKQFAGIDSLYRDVNTGKEIGWHNYMERVINGIGIDNIKPYIPFSIDLVREAIKTDEHLNNLSIDIWDSAARAMRSPLTRKGITYFSLSDRVCILKETARILAERGE